MEARLNSTFAESSTLDNNAQTNKERPLSRMPMEIASILAAMMMTTVIPSREMMTQVEEISLSSMMEEIFVRIQVHTLCKSILIAPQTISKRSFTTEKLSALTTLTSMILKAAMYSTPTLWSDS